MKIKEIIPLYMVYLEQELQMFAEDCEKLGYNIGNKGCNDAEVIKLNGNTTDSILKEDNSFKKLWLFPKKHFQGYGNLGGGLKIIEFYLDTSYIEALQFMRDNMFKYKNHYEIY